MSHYPRYLIEYPNVSTTFPFYMYKFKPKLPPITPHRHNFLELNLVLQGEGIETINGLQHRLQPGTMVLLLPYQIHEITYNIESKPFLYTCNFDIELLMDGTNAGDAGFSAIFTSEYEAELPYVQLDEKEMQEMLRLFESMFEEYEGNLLWRNYRIKALLMEAIIRYIRKQSPRHGIRSSSNPSLQKNVWPVIQYIHTNYQEPLTLQDLSKRFHFHTTHLSELIKQHVGQSFVHLLHEIRVRHACSLLRSTILPVSTISLEVGCGSLQTFSRIFRQLKGCTPVEYRKMKDGWNP